MQFKKLFPLVFGILLCSCYTAKQQQIRKSGFKKGIFAKIVTPKGIILARLEYEKSPLAVASFVGLAQGIIPNTAKKAGVPFYDSLKFHRVLKGYMLIGGCPKGDGTGNAGYYFFDEFNSELKHDKPGILSMDNNGENLNSCIFNISLKASSALDNKYVIFGEIISGMEVANSIQQGDLISKIEIIKIGRKAEAFDPIKVFEKNGFNNMIKLKQ